MAVRQGQATASLKRDHSSLYQKKYKQTKFVNTQVYSKNCTLARERDGITSYLCLACG